jgi:hypothetical protein
MDPNIVGGRLLMPRVATINAVDPLTSAAGGPRPI